MSQFFLRVFFWTKIGKKQRFLFDVAVSHAGLPYRAEAQFPDGITLWKLDSVDVDDPNHAASGTRMMMISEGSLKGWMFFFGGFWVFVKATSRPQQKKLDVGGIIILVPLHTFFHLVVFEDV